MRSRKSSGIAQAPPALAHIKNIRAMIVFATATIFIDMRTQIIVIRGRSTFNIKILLIAYVHWFEAFHPPGPHHFVPG